MKKGIEKEIKPRVFYGTSGIVLPVPNKQLFPEAFIDKSRLTYYASLFNSLEVNSTFKKLPRASTVEKWAAEVPDDFEFTFKLPASVTHNKGLTFEKQDVKGFLQIVGHAGAKKGALLVQFPGKLTAEHRPQLEKLLTLLSTLKISEGWKIAVEFRHASWYHHDTYQLLNQHAVAMVLHDLPPAPPELHKYVGTFVYLRFHGTEKGYRGSYPDSSLQEYAKHVHSWLAAGKSVYIYFNNTLGAAAANLISLRNFIENQ